MKKQLLLWLSIMSAVGVLLFFIFGMKEDPRKSLEHFLGTLLPPQMEVTGFDKTGSIGWSIRVYELRVDDEALKAMMSGREFSSVQYPTSEESYENNNIVNRLLDRYGKFKIPDSELAEYKYYWADHESHSIRMLVKPPKAYCAITR